MIVRAMLAVVALLFAAAGAQAGRVLQLTAESSPGVEQGQQQASAQQQVASAQQQLASVQQQLASALQQLASALQQQASALQQQAGAQAQQQASGQAQQLTTAQPRASGVRPPWEARKTTEQIREPLAKLDTTLGAIRPGNWQGVGAANYVPVIEGARRRVRALLEAIDVIAQQPDRVSNVARLFIALYQVETPVDSVVNGASQFRDYEAVRALQEGMVGLLNQRENFVQYLLELSEFGETSARLGQRELESCRQQLARVPSAPPPARKAVKR